MVDFPAPLWPTSDVIFLPGIFRLIVFKILASSFLYSKETLLNWISLSDSSNSFAPGTSLTSFTSSITGKTFLAPINPCWIVIFKVANDLTGWYANIIAARKEKKLLTSNSFSATSLAEINMRNAIIIPVKASIIGEALTKTICIFLDVSFKLLIYFRALSFS